MAKYDPTGMRNAPQKIRFHSGKPQTIVHRSKMADKAALGNVPAVKSIGFRAAYRPGLSQGQVAIGKHQLPQKA